MSLKAKKGNGRFLLEENRMRPCTIAEDKWVMMMDQNGMYKKAAAYWEIRLTGRDLECKDVGNQHHD
jgi:hypothetical protein